MTFCEFIDIKSYAQLYKYIAYEFTEPKHSILCCSLWLLVDLHDNVPCHHNLTVYFDYI
jgi:hypothetical protein